MLVLTPWQGDATQLSTWGLSSEVVEISPPPQEMVEVSPPPQGSVVLFLHHYKSKKHLVKTQINTVLHFKFQKESHPAYHTAHHKPADCDRSFSSTIEITTK